MRKSAVNSDTFMHRLRAGKICLMGILNVTPDSFFDGDVHQTPDDVVIHADKMAHEGAHILDIGAESTRPDAGTVDAKTEWDRLENNLAALVKKGPSLPISIDTYKADIAQKALDAGAHIINDVSAFQKSPDMSALAAQYQCPVILNHWDEARDRKIDVIEAMKLFFDTVVNIALKSGIKHNNIILDPGFGFGKNLTENYIILSRLDALLALGFPMLIGTSRKSMIGRILGNEPSKRLAGTLATSIQAHARGARFFRIHDVAPHKDALTIAESTLYPDCIKQAAP